MTVWKRESASVFTLTLSFPHSHSLTRDELQGGDDPGAEEEDRALYAPTPRRTESQSSTPSVGRVSEEAVSQCLRRQVFIDGNRYLFRMVGRILIRALTIDRARIPFNSPN